MDLFGEEPVAAPESPPSVIEQEPEDVFQHPRLMNFCLGHKHIEHNLLELYNSGRLPHAMIFSGLKGTGKATFAYRFARFLLKHGHGADTNQDNLFGDAPSTPETMDVDVDDPVFKLVSSGAHPDLLMVERQYDTAKNRFKGQVDVAKVRKVLPFLRMTSSEGGWRIVIIDDADTMNRNAQNAILKILEEPPAYTILILVAHRAGSLIPTIKSRARTINFDALNNQTMEALLQKSHPHLSPKESQSLIDLSGHSFGQALNLIEEGGLEIFDETIIHLDNLPQINWPDIHAFAEGLARKGQEARYKSFTEAMLWVFEHLIKAKARGISASSDILQKAVFERFLNDSSLEVLLETWQNLSSHFAKVERANLDKRQGVIGAFSILQT